MKRSQLSFLGLTLAGLAVGTTASAADSNQNNATLHGILAGSYQAGSESRDNGQDIDGEGTGQLYLMGTLDMGLGTWHLEARGSTTSENHAISSRGTNALVGETAGPDGDGRIAATQFYYELPAGPGSLRAGLLDPTAVLDGDPVANDEYTQFLAGSFVNNPTISFPSFVLGGAYQADLNQQFDYTLFLGSDSGLEGDDPTYGNVFDVGGDRDGHDKGAFMAGELGWHANGYSLKGGLWYDTGNAEELGGGGSANPYGLYALAGMPVGKGRIQARFGIANDDTQRAADFESVAYQLPTIKLQDHDTMLGVAVSRTGDSDELGAGSDPIYRAEAYWRVHVYGPAYISPDIQYVDNAGFDSDADGTFVGGIRATAEF